MKKLKFLFFPTILVLAFGLMLSCAKSAEDNVNDTIADTNDAIDDGVGNTNDNLGNILGGGSSNPSSCNNSIVSIVGNAVTEKNCHPN